MRPHIASLSALLAAALGALGALAALATAAAAVTVSGTLTPAYGPPLVVQTSQSNVGGTGYPSDPANTNAGSQLDAGYGYIANGTLYLFFSGNLQFWLQLEGIITHWQPLDVYLDCAPGGQHTLLANNPVIEPTVYDLTRVAGLTFDDGFAADRWFSLGGSFQHEPWPTMHAYTATLPTAGGGVGTYLGATASGPPGALTGGTNPDGIQVAWVDDNRLGLGSGCGPAASPAVTTGIEWAIPLAALGNPTGCVRVCAFVSDNGHEQVSNQVLGPLPPGTCVMTPAASVNFASVPGDQFFTVCPATPAPNATWGSVKALYR